MNNYLIACLSDDYKIVIERYKHNIKLTMS